MNNYFKLAWRNIWRNRRRTLITIASIFFAMFFAVFMRSYQLGSYTNMINSVVVAYSGHLQIQDNKYFKNQTINNSLLFTDDLRSKIESIEEIASYDPRIQSGLLASSGLQSKIGIVLGVEPQKADKLTNLSSRIITIHISDEALEKIKKLDIPEKTFLKIKELKGDYYKDEIDLGYELKLSKDVSEKYLPQILEATKFEGEFFKKDDSDVMVAYRLAQYLNLNIGDSIILLGQGYHGASAVGKYKIKAFLKFPGLDFNNSMVYMTLKNSQELFSAYQIADNNIDTTFMVNYIALNTNEKINISGSSEKKIRTVKKEIENIIKDENISVLFWKKTNKELVQQIDSDNISGQMMLAILYIIIGFGIFGTVLMMVAERKREFGVMIAIGMKKYKLAIVVIFEMIFMGLIGVITGAIATAPWIILGYYFPARLKGDMAKAMEQFNIEPIMPMEWFDVYIINQAVIIFVMVAFTMIYPIIKILFMKVIKALKS